MTDEATEVLHQKYLDDITATVRDAVIVTEAGMEGQSEARTIIAFDHVLREMLADLLGPTEVVEQVG